ncbi:intermembrane transport protein PqiB [Suttonella indologenes]|uniref:Paraquat-inducible protein B n=1 Tax=Suttonella indologenes TaxID=13276 RepID=A0A380N131_9GAMM|nr:MlaD family protein [Suttonella indologenes]SUO98499.1 paraquat-inducible protein B [Suttonella indologenes]
MQEPERKQNRFSFLWLLPVFALAAGLYLAYARYNRLGPSIQIELENAAGIEANRTKIRYRAVEIGTVSSIAFTEDLKKVIVSAQMTHNATSLLRRDAKFWVVRPQISLSGITGLDTIVSGSFIAIEPGISEEKARRFVGLDKAPLIDAGDIGIRVRMVTNTAKGLYSGSPVYYRGIKVGQIETVQFNDEFDRIYVEAFINRPYDQLINSNTKFWNISGVNFAIGPNGAEISMESLETLALGGITFSTPMSLNQEEKHLDEDTLFTLYENEKDIYQSINYQKQYYVLYFSDSLRGLKAGARVEFDGIEIGQVIDIRLIYDEKKEQAVMPVLIEVEPERITRVNGEEAFENLEADAAIFDNLVSKGLKASLESANLITGTKFVRLSMYHKEPEGKLTKDSYSAYSIMPTKNTGLNKITEDIGIIVERVKKLPFDSLFAKANSTMGAIHDAVSQKEVQELAGSINSTLAQFEQTLASVQSTSQSANTLLRGLNSQIASVSKQLEQTLYGISPSSNLYFNLNQTMQALEKTAKSIDRVMLQIDAKPNSLIFGD